MSEAFADPGEPVPAVEVVTPSMVSQPLPPPKQLIFFYSPDEFEKFTHEWVRVLDTRYVRVEVHGGAGDHGVDVAAFLTPHGLEGDWHSFQCKHYGKPLDMATVLPEMLKVFRSVVEGYYCMPSRYVFVAPQTARATVKTLSRPNESRQMFLQWLDKPGNRAITALPAAVRQAVRALAEATTFSRFEAAELDDILDLHEQTRFWSARFGQPLKPRPPARLPPPDHEPEERYYVEQLLEVYREKWGEVAGTLSKVAEHSKAKEHLYRQRVAYFSADSLRVFARESVPDGYFETLQQDVYDVVVEVADRSFKTGYDRVQEVLAKAASIRLTQTILISRVKPLDAMGVCHHLANDDKLTWCQEGDG